MMTILQFVAHQQPTAAETAGDKQNKQITPAKDI